MLKIALAEFGITEIKGKSHNERILEYSKDLGVEWVKTDETSWCSIYLSWCALKSGLPYPKTIVTARHWLNVGEPVDSPQVGDIAVFWRVSRSSWQGHVGIFIRRENDKIYVLGGNQDNQVNIKPYSADRLLGYKRL